MSVFLGRNLHKIAVVNGNVSTWMDVVDFYASSENHFAVFLGRHELMASIRPAHITIIWATFFLNSSLNNLTQVLNCIGKTVLRIIDLEVLLSLPSRIFNSALVRCIFGALTFTYITLYKVFLKWLLTLWWYWFSKMSHK